MPRGNRSKSRLKKTRGGKNPAAIHVDEHTLILKIINDASKELNKNNEKAFFEKVYSLRNMINKLNGEGFSENERKEVKELLRRAKIAMLLNDKELEFKALSQIEKDIMKAFRG